MWNLTNSRFIPYSLAEFFYNIQDNYDDITRAQENSQVPDDWIRLN
jgi:hypothetical protein